MSKRGKSDRQPMNRASIWRPPIAICLLLITGLLASCDGPNMTENDQFELAEHEYQAGNYTEALNAYEVFLKHYYTSPLTPIARQRILTINREVSTVMRRKGSPAPEYLKPGTELEQKEESP